MSTAGWVLSAIGAAIVVLVLVAIGVQLPEIRRYMKIRGM